jgi:hypothetical protein
MRLYSVKTIRKKIIDIVFSITADYVLGFIFIDKERKKRIRCEENFLK